MRAQIIAAGAAVLLGTLTACGQSNDNSPAANNQAGSTPASEVRPTGPTTTDAQAPPIAGTGTATALPPGATVLPQDRIDSGGMPNQREVAIGPDGRTLTLNVMARDACSGVEATVTEENAQAVKIELTPMMLPQGGQPDRVCAQVLTPRQVTVTLKEPLGNRKLVITEGY